MHFKLKLSTVVKLKRFVLDLDHRKIKILSSFNHSYGVPNLTFFVLQNTHTNIYYWRMLTKQIQFPLTSIYEQKNTMEVNGNRNCYQHSLKYFLCSAEEWNA